MNPEQRQLQQREQKRLEMVELRNRLAEAERAMANPIAVSTDLRPPPVQRGSYVSDDDFICQHGGNPVVVLAADQRTKHHLLPDGAVLVRNEWGPTWTEPPVDPLARLVCRRNYWSQQLKQIDADLDKYRLTVQGLDQFQFQWNAALYGPAQATVAGSLTLMLRLAQEDRDNIADLDETINALLFPKPE